MAKTVSYVSENCKGIMDGLISLGTKHAVWNAFEDWLKVCSISISNTIDWNNQSEREKQYLETISKYTPKEQEILTGTFAELISALQTEATTSGPSDLLGMVFHGLELHNKYHGQFFTPLHMCEFMGEVVLGDSKDAQAGTHQVIAEKGHVSVCEPCVGSGGLVLGFAKAMHNHKLNYCNQMVAYCCDIDIKCVHMAYLQLSLYGIPAVIIHGNSLTGEEWSRWYTPTYMVNGWAMREKVTNVIETISRATKQNSKPTVVVPKHDLESTKFESVEYEQLTLL